MSVVYAWIGGAILAAPALMYFGYTPIGWGAAIVLGLIGTLAWGYSPLPDNNGGYMAGDRGRYWGFKRPEKTNKEEA